MPWKYPRMTRRRTRDRLVSEAEEQRKAAAQKEPPHIFYPSMS